MDETAKALKNIERMGQTQKEAENRYKKRLLDVQEEIKKDVADIKKLTKIKDCVKKCKKGKEMMFKESYRFLAI